MRRTMLVAVALLLSAGLLGGMAGCQRQSASPVPAGDAESSAVNPSTSTSTTTGSDSSGSTSTSADETKAPATPKTMKVKLYFGYEDRVMAVTREVPYSQGVAKTAMTELLKGPSAAELKGLALHNEIPKGTKVLGVSMNGHTARVDLSKEFDDGGGTLSMTMRLAQVVYTLTQYSTIESVEFYMEGKRVQTFSSEGLELDGPQRAKDYYELIPIDA